MQIGRLPALLLGILAPLASRAPAEVAQIGFDLKREYVIVVPCTLPPAGRFRCVIDTGTDESVLDVRLAKRLGLATQPTSVTTFNADRIVESANLPVLQLGPIQATRLPVFVADLSASSESFGTRVDAIVGLDALRQTSLMIDYGKRLLTFGAGCPSGERGALMPGLPFAVLQAEVDGNPVRLKLDTGWSGLLLYRNRVKGVTTSAGAERDELQTAFGGSLAAKRVHVHDLSIGGLRLSDVAATVLDEGPSGFDGYDGVVGPRALHASLLCFDFEHRVVRLRP